MTHLTNSPPLCHYHITFGNQHSSLNFYINFVDWTYECDYEALVIVYHYIACFFCFAHDVTKDQEPPFLCIVNIQFYAHNHIFYLNSSTDEHLS